MTDAFAQQSFQAPPAPATVANVMRPPLTTVEQAAHVAAAAYLMKHAGATALLIRDGHTDQPIGIITQAWVPQLGVRLVTEKCAVTCGNAKKPSDGACH